LTKDEVLMG